jgi:cytochrome P450 family 135
MASTTARQPTIAFEPGEAMRGLPPGLKMPPTLQTVLWAAAPTWLMNRCARQLGDSFTLRLGLGGPRLVMFSDPRAVKMLFTAPADVAPKAAGNSPVARVMGASSVLVETGPAHMRQRKLLLPVFHGERIREHEAVMADATRRDMAGWPMGTPMRMLPPMRAITLDVILRAVFGVEAERMGPLKEAIDEVIDPVHLRTVLRMLVSPPSGERPPGTLGRALDRLDKMIYAEIEHRRAQSDLESRSDIMSLLLLARDDDGVGLTEEELRNELVTQLLAGHETAATSAAWALERLVRHPDKLRRLTAEVDAHGDGGGDAYLTAVVNETMRVRPVAPVVFRMLKQELQVGRYLLPEGTLTVASVYLTNRNPQVYENPTAFEPERFLEDAPETFSWIPFGGGIRRCIGATFAQLERKVILRTILSELEPRAPDGWRGRYSELTRRPKLILVPSRGATVVWRRRA